MQANYGHLKGYGRMIALVESPGASVQPSAAASTPQFAQHDSQIAKFPLQRRLATQAVRQRPNLGLGDCCAVAGDWNFHVARKLSTWEQMGVFRHFFPQPQLRYLRKKV